MKNKLSLLASLTFLFVFTSLNVPAQAPQSASATSKPDHNFNEYVLKEVGNIHGVAGPFAVVGYRIGARALTELQMLKGEFDLDATHNTLPEVQWSCIADGILAATGASVGKLNLHLNLIADKKDAQSIIINKKTGEKVIFRLSEGFLQRYYNVPFPELAKAGRTVLDLRDEDIFTMQIIVEKQNKKPSPFERKRQESNQKAEQQKAQSPKN